MKQLESLSILIVIPDLQSKTKLREVLRTFLYKGELHYERSLVGLAERIADPVTEKYDIIFLSAKSGQKEISEFLGRISKITEQKVPAVIISLTSGSSQSSSAVATWYLEGVSGFISDPYTSEDLTQLLSSIIEQRNKNGTAPSGNKSRKAAGFLLADAMSLIDEVARLSFEGKEGGYPLRDLKALAKNFADFQAQDPEAYEHALIETFMKAKPPTWANVANRAKSKSKQVKHPGALVWELMAQRNLSEDRLVGLLRLEAAEVAALTRGQLNVDEGLAQNLSRVFGMSSREWVKMQKDFDAYQAKIGGQKGEKA